MAKGLRITGSGRCINAGAFSFKSLPTNQVYIVVKFQTPKSLTAILYEIWIFFLVWFLVKWCTNRCTPPNNKAWKQKPINTDFVPKFAQTAIPLKYVSISVTCFWNVSQKQKQGVAVWAKMGTTCIKEICLNFLFCFSISVATHFEVIKSYCQNWTQVLRYCIIDPGKFLSYSITTQHLISINLLNNQKVI